MRPTFATFCVLAALLDAYGAAAGRESRTVPRIPMPEPVLKTFRAALESYPFDEASKKELVAKNLDALENLRSAPWPKLDGLERVRVYNPKEPKRYFSTWRQPADADDLILLMPDLTERRVPKSAFARIESADYAGELADLLKFLKERDPEKKRPWDFTYFWDFGAAGLPFYGGAFLLHHAYAAACLGKEPEAKTLVHEALKQHRLCFEQAYNEGAWQSFLRGIALLEERAPRTDVLAQWQEALRDYGRSRYHDQLLDLTEQLTRQVEEDKTLGAAKVEGPEKLPLEERIAYYIARFPDVRGAQVSQPGHCQTFGMGEQTKYSDAIVKIGRPALPALVAHLADRRVTRSIGFWRNFAPSREVLRVQDVAIECIQAILDIRFYVASGTSSYLSNERPEIREKVIADVTSWWQEYGQKSRVEGLIGRLEQGELRERMATLRKIEAIDRKAVDSIATLKRWLAGGERGDVTLIAGALADRGDLSLLPTVRDMVRKGDASEGAVWFVLERGDVEDYRFLRDAARKDVAAGLSVSTPCMLRTLAGTVRSMPRPFAVPLLVEFLARREITGSRYAMVTKTTTSYSCADECMETLIRLTKHDEDYRTDDPQEKRYAAIDRWTAWWEKEGKAEYARKHPEVTPLLGDDTGRVQAISPGDLPRLVSVADADRQVPVTYDVPRGDMAALAKAGALDARRDPEGTMTFSFASPGAAADWLSKARPVLPEAREGAKPSLTLLDPGHRLGHPLIAPDGRLWFWDCGDRNVAIGDLKREIEAACSAEQARGTGAQVLHVEHTGRVWFTAHPDHRLLLGYDPKTKVWIERPGLPPAERAYYKEGSPKVWPYAISGPVFESRSGRVFCGDRLGVHVLDGGAWSYQHFYERNCREDRWAGPKKTFDTAHFAEDAEGNVYAWTPWGDPRWPDSASTGTIGFWTFDGKRWTNVDTVERIESIIPRTPGEIWLLLPKGEMVLLRDRKLVPEEEAQKALCPGLRFRKAHLALTGPDGTSYLALEDVTVLEPLAKLRHRGLALPLRGPALDLGTEAGDLIAYNRVVAGPPGWIFGSRQAVKAMSSDGKAFRTYPQTARLSSLALIGGDGRRFLYLYGSGGLWRLDTEADPTLDEGLVPRLPAMRVRAAGFASPDSLGRMWCTLDTVGSPTAVFGGSAWKTFPQPSTERETGQPRGFYSAFPGRDGAMIFEDREYHFHLFDSAGRATAKTLAQLILEQPERVRKAVPEPLLSGTNRPVHLATDAGGRIWWAAGNHGWGLIDGGKAIDAAASGIAPRGQWLAVLFPLGDGRRLVASDGRGPAAIVELRDGRIVQAAPSPVAVQEMPPRGWRPCVLRDSSGRVWIVDRTESQAIGPNGDRVATHAGWLMLEDRQHGLWFHLHAWDRVPRVVRVAPDGREVGVDIPDLLERACLSEAPDGTVWALTFPGLIRLRADHDALSVIERYPIRIEHTDDLWCNPGGHVWVRHTEPGERIAEYLIRYATTAKAE